jgi:hypothetical protein
MRVYSALGLVLGLALPSKASPPQQTSCRNPPAMTIYGFEVLLGHDGAWLPLAGQRADALSLRYALLDRFRKGGRTPEESLADYQALAFLDILPADAVFYLIASVLVDDIAPPRILSLFQELQASRPEDFCQEDAHCEPADLARIAEQVTAQTMCDHREWAMADLFLNDRVAFDGRISAGRSFFHGQ